MFTHVKKDYYSVNAKIALDPITEQQTLQKMLTSEQTNAMAAMNNIQNEQSMMMSQGADD